MHSFNADGTIVAPPEHWLELTDAQHYLLIEAFEEARLFESLRGWAVCEDPVDWSAIARHAGPLLAAARCLLEWNLIEIWSEPYYGVGEGSALPTHDAYSIVGDVRCWSINWVERDQRIYRFCRGSTADSLGRNYPAEQASRLGRIAYERRHEPPWEQLDNRLRAEP